jgi:hypothetical protein
MQTKLNLCQHSNSELNICSSVYTVSVKEWYDFGDNIRWNYNIPLHNQNQRNIRFSEISKFAVYLHITYLYRQATQFSEMASPLEKSVFGIEYAKTNSCTNFQRAFRWRFLKDPPLRALMQRWFGNSESQGCICKKGSGGRPHVGKEDVPWVKDA